ncbi:hypothetical protein LJC07_05020 [Christensenellaceae bacterium OttesenSCG-928-L17]|nr:hypothetical protein [Christensenellaceae bacterium OttesenSCG-928-L17]
MKTRLTFIIAVFSLLLTLQISNNSSALTVSGFDPGNIMSDYVMGNKNTMSINDIQAFLNSKIKNCTTDQLRGYSNEARAIAPCLKDFRENGQTAAQIIWQASQDYSINPQVLIVLLQKEQSLITDTWPRDGWWWTLDNLGEAKKECTNSRGEPSYCVNIQYRSATGYGCPDTAPCSSQYFGFTNQIRKAASLFRTVLDGGWSNYPIGDTWVPYNPDSRCGGSVINIKNRATSALYRYTSYQPNGYALSGLGSDTSYPNCAAFGNRNFYSYFTEWFGSTQEDGFKPLDTPRWMELKADTTKVFVYSGDPAGEALEAGRQIRFVDKILLNEVWYLRTEFNKNDGGAYGIPLDYLKEIEYVPTEESWMTFKENGNRSHPASRTSIGDNLIRGTIVKVVDQITIDGNIYYRTEYNKNNNGDFGIHSRFLESGVTPINLDSPRNFCSTSIANRLDIATNETTPSKFTTVFINKKVIYNNTWYFQSQSDNGTTIFINSAQLADGECPSYVSFSGPRNMRISRNVSRFNPFTGEQYDTLLAGTIAHFSSKIYINEEWYYRTSYNTQRNIDAVIPATAVSEL